jgi:DNA-binding NarL/FixJ family response regulator
MEYKQFIVRAFEHKPEKWRASVERVDRKALMAMTNRRKLFKFITGVDAKSEQDAVLMAIAAIDAGAFSKHRAIHKDSPEAWRTTLTDREREIARLAVQGLGNQEIAKRLGLADGTVRFQVHNILRKLGLKTRADLA